MDQPLWDNRELALAWEYVEHTHRHVFLTGKAGTGKTTFLQRLKKASVKQMVITAPTGVAAVNAGGVTLHSFFQLPFGPFVPGSHAFEDIGRRHFRFSREKKRIIKGLDLLVIDEISMVRADLLDSVDAVLRRQRRNDSPFGGVQLLMIGDLNQLSPVAKSQEWSLLQKYYDTVYFFSSQALDLARLTVVELQEIFRQSDAGFIRLLNRIRDNRLDQESARELDMRVRPDFLPQPGQGWITLTTHNKKADAVNGTRMSQLSGPEVHLEARVEGDFPSHAFPGPQTLILKKGAQVMFLRNDPLPEKRYYNGKIGRVAAVGDNEVLVSCGTDEIRVEVATWENIKYSVNEETGQIQEQVMGEFKQFPLKPAWAVTIHKSQGLTFDRVIIDAQAAFAPGQVYVALSRCKSLDGLVLSSPISGGGLGCDPAVSGFSRQARGLEPDQDHLYGSKLEFQQNLLIRCFDCWALEKKLGFFTGLIQSGRDRIHITGLADPAGLREQAETHIFSVSQKFLAQMQKAFTGKTLPEADPYIRQRTAKASGWFCKQFLDILDGPLKAFAVETDNRELGKRINGGLDRLRQEARVKLAGIRSCEKGFSPVLFLKAVSRAALESDPLGDKPCSAPQYNESDIRYPALFEQLKAWRADKADELDLPRFHILHQKVLVQVAVRLPDSEAALAGIKGVGQKTLEKYGEDILAMVRTFRKAHGIDKVALPRAGQSQSDPVSVKAGKTKKLKKDTRRESVDLYEKGLSPDQIALERGLTRTTVVGHLCAFVEKGALDIDGLVAGEKQDAVEAVVLRDKTGSLKSIKTVLGDAFSYDEIRLVMSRLKFLGSVGADT